MKKLIVKPVNKSCVININANEICTVYGMFSFDKISFEFSYYNVFQVMQLWKNETFITTLFFDKNDRFALCNKDSCEYTKCNRGLEMLLSKYNILKGGE